MIDGQREGQTDVQRYKQKEKREHNDKNRIG